MDPDSTLFLILSIILFFGAAFFTLIRSAVISLNDLKLKKAAEEDRRAARIAKMLEHPNRFLDSMFFAFVFCTLGVGALSTLRTAGLIAGAVLRHQNSGGWALAGIALLFVFLLSMLLVIPFAYIIPKRLGQRHPEGIAFSLSSLIRALYCILFPFCAVSSFLGRIFGKLFRVSEEKYNENVTEEEIRMLVDAGEENGIIEQSEKDMINNVFEFDDRTAEDIMTHRTELVAVEETDTLVEITNVAVEEGYSRIPVYADTLDNIVGILYVKDLLKLVPEQTQGAPFDVRDYMRSPLYVPESKRCTELFALFKQKKVQMAIVVDEYGGTAGVVTMEDLIESIVGNIQDEYDEEEEEILKLTDNIYLLDGSTALEDVERILDITFSEEDSDDYDTIGGLLTDRIGHIPAQNEHPAVEMENVRFTVVNTSDRCISKIRAEILPKMSPQEAPET